MNLYSARHTVARWLRQQRVPFEEVAGQIGRRMPEFAITEIYAAYLLQAITARAQSFRP